MMRKSVIAAACVSIVIGSPARAQETVAPPRSFISAEFGAQSFLSDLTKAEEGMYTQYRAKPGAVALHNLAAQWMPVNSRMTYSLFGTNVGYNDMALAARATNAGLWDAQFRWDRSPHTYSGQYSTLLTGSGALPAARPATVSAWNTAAAGNVFTDPIRNQWDNAKLSFRVTPTEALASKVEYTFIRKSGDKSTGFAFGSPGGNSMEALEPIDNTTHDVKVSQSWARKNYQLQASYNLSLFTNDTWEVFGDNPLRATDATTATARGQMSAMPDNSMHAFNLGGAWKLPYKTRVTGAYTWSVWNQDDDMLPAYNNSTITGTNATNAALNPTHLDGRAGTKVLNLEVSSKPFDNLMNGLFKGVGLGAKFRRFEFRDEIGETIDSVFAFGTPDAGNGSWHQPLRSGFRREERELSARWAGRYPVAFGVEYEYEMLQNNPEHANVFKTLETGPKVTFDFTGIERMKFHAQYAALQRRAEAFSVDGVFMGTWQVLPIENDAFRNPLYADRDRTRFVTMLTVYPTDQISVTGTFETGEDEYLADGADVTFGFQKYNGSAWGLDADYTPFARLTLNAGYSIDQFDDQMQSRYRTPTNRTNPTYIWLGSNEDEVTTYYVGATGVVLPNRIDAGFRFEHSFSRYLTRGWNPVTPTGGSANDNASATAGTFPEITTKLEPMNMFVSYRINSEWSTTLRFQTEKWDQNDYRFAFTGPTQAAYRPLIANSTSATSTAVNHVFMGNEYPSYNAQLLTITMTYRPNLMRFGKPAL